METKLKKGVETSSVFCLKRVFELVIKDFRNHFLCIEFRDKRHYRDNHVKKFDPRCTENIFRFSASVFKWRKNTIFDSVYKMNGALTSGPYDSWS